MDNQLKIDDFDNIRGLKKERTMLELEHALLNTLREKPFSEIKINDIIRRALISKQTFYNFCGSLNGLLDRIVDRRLKRWAVNTIDPQNWTGNCRERLRFTYVTLGKEIKQEKHLWQNVSISELSISRKEVLTNITKIFQEGQKAGQITKDFPAKALAWQLNTIQLALCLDWANDRISSNSLLLRQRQALDIFLGGIEIN
ncbi:MAG: TetR/AcrR family transcriptional regulator [Spirochaetota bacterium]